MATFSTNLALFRAWCRLLAKQGFVVASVDFRNSAGSSIRTPFPGGLNDCICALKWLVHRKRITDITVLGESGGANLAISTTVHAAKQRFTHGKLKGLMAIDPFITGPSVWPDWPTSNFRSLRDNNGAGSFSEDWFNLGRLYTPNEIH